MLGIFLLTLSLHSSLSLNEHNIRKYGFVNGDIIIGVLLPIHEQPAKGINSVTCGDIRDQYGMQRVEAILKTINEINNNPKILRGIKLGVEIRDTCWDIPIALEQCLDVIKNIVDQRKFDNNQTLNTQSVVNNNLYKKGISALLGPASSDITIDVQNLMQLFKIPQVGYSATTIELSDKEAYKYFLRVVPSDKLQVKALVDLIRHFKWTYISLLNSVDVYGSKGIKELTDQIKSIDSICIANQLEVDDKDDIQVLQNITNLLLSDPKAKVIICFCQGNTVTKLLQAIINLNKTREGYLIIGTDGWADRTEILGPVIDKKEKKRELSSAAVGAITLRLHSSPLLDFDNYFLSKGYNNTDGNPWFQEFWEHKFKCSIQVSEDSRYKEKCSGRESLYDQTDYVQDSKLGFVVKSVITVAMGLHQLMRKDLPFLQNTKSGFIFINGSLLMNEMLNLSFVGYDNEVVKFDANGDPPGRYDIMNYQYSYDATAGRKIFKYETVGNWKDNVLLINKAIRWPEHKMLGNIPIKSICSRLCNLDQIRIFNQKKRCCWSCRSCSKTQYINKSAGFDEKCVKCPKGFLATSKKTECKEIDPSFTHWEDVGSIMAIIFSCIGLIITIAIMAILAKFHNTPVVKSSTRELMYAILVGIALSYLTIFPLLHKPTVLSCYLTRIMPGLSFSLIFGSLVTKTNRIFRILAISKKKIIYRKGRFLTTTAQIVIVFLLNVIEIAIISAMIWQQPPNPIKLYISTDKVYLICNTPSSSLMISMGFDAILIAFCTWYAFKTRNLPENFNEAKFIGFTMYTTCIIWIGLVVIYLSTDLQVISLCFAIDLTATICIILLFLPKVYIILFRPEKNERSAFTTTTEIQCHIGSGSNNQNLKKNSKVLPKIQQATDSPNYSHTNLNNLDEDFLSLKSSFNNLPLIEGLIKPAVGKENKIIQTDSSLIEEVVHNSLSICKEENFVLISQMISCFDSLKFDWSKIFIPHRLNIELTNGMHSVTEITPVKFMDEN